MVGRTVHIASEATEHRLASDGDRFALTAVPADVAAAKQDKVVFIFNFFDELRRVAPAAKR